MTKIDSSTLHKNIMGSSQENLQENYTGANSMPTPSPQGAHKGNIVQSSPDEFDAVAGARIKKNNDDYYLTQFIFIG